MILQKILNFWDKYEHLNLKIALTLMGLQIVHLFWLTTDVVIPRIFETNALFPEFLIPVLIFVDFIEIPALITGGTFYIISTLRNKSNRPKNILLFIALIIQIIHIFWITDEFVVKALTGTTLLMFPLYFAWIAILIDYLELPVIFDLLNRTIKKKL